MVVKLLTRTVFWLAALAALLFGAAGRRDWPVAWLFLMQMAALGLAPGLWLARHDPGVLEQRLGPAFDGARSNGGRRARGRSKLRAPRWLQGWLRVCIFQ